MTNPVGSIGYPAARGICGTQRQMELPAGKRVIDPMKSAATTPDVALGKNHHVR
jgi:hypothetical protein